MFISHNGKLAGAIIGYRALRRFQSEGPMETDNQISDSESSPVDPSARVESFRRTRNNRRTELIEDYVELIADLIADSGEARQVDIALRLGVAQPTVAKMLKRLATDGYIQQRRYRGIFLTDMGKQLAQESRERHQIVETFLCAIGISIETARIDAEGIEHHVSPETLEAFKRFVAQKE